MKFALLAAVALACVAPAAPAAAASRPFGMTPERIIAWSDANKDGVVTKDEVRRWPRGSFDRADADKDGKVTLDELKADWAIQYPKK